MGGSAAIRFGRRLSFHNPDSAAVFIDIFDVNAGIHLRNRAYALIVPYFNKDSGRLSSAN